MHKTISKRLSLTETPIVLITLLSYHLFYGQFNTCSITPLFGNCILRPRFRGLSKMYMDYLGSQAISSTKVFDCFIPLPTHFLGPINHKQSRHEIKEMCVKKTVYFYKQLHMHVPLNVLIGCKNQLVPKRCVVLQLQLR